MKFLYSSPYIIIAWTMLILVHESYIKNKPYDAGIFISSILFIIFIYLAIKKYKQKIEHYHNHNNIIAINIGLIPLIFANILLSNIVLKGTMINENGMIYILVFIYSPVLYAVTLIGLTVYKYLKDKLKHNKT
ncbi:hypothetical protein [Sulfurimonas sp.]|uniref:hypothetical protein n=1 Tax=Sulfurimonas sp. TaxID=2022749 RepID=UPI002B499B01|nr:hypothetical protein [Sulfurimonas sp.]